jgi:hypothetical protein
MRLIEFLQQGGLVNDPNKIQSIINKYGNGKSPFKASDYIEVSKSTGVPVELLLAQGIAESNLGTAGRAVTTKNVGNVGNTDSGAAEYRNSWLDGLYRQANLLRNEYKVTGLNDIQRLVSNNFKRPIGGNYASASNYGTKVGNLINSFSNVKIDLSKTNYNPTTVENVQTNDSPPQMQAFYQTLPDDMKKNLSWDNFSTIAKSNPSILGVFNVDTQKQFEENIRLENERQQQEQKKSEIEYENQQIQLALQEKQQQREQILSMIPQAQSINSGQIKPQFREGGKIRRMVYQLGGKNN